MDEKLKKVLKQLAITVGLLTIGFWVLVNLGNTLTGNNQFVSLDKALFFAVALVAFLLIIRIAIFMTGIFGGAVKDEVRDKGPLALVPHLWGIIKFSFWAVIAGAIIIGIIKALFGYH